MPQIIPRLKKMFKAYCGSHYKRFVLDELIFSVTYKCNFRCKTCFYGEVMDNYAKNAQKELSIDEIKKISLSIGNFKHLLISGGEPFLRDDLVEICRIFCQQNKIIGIHLPTNGFDTEKIYACTRKILEQCPQIYLSLSLSLDGLEETHDKIKGVMGSFTKTVETTRRIATLKKEFKRLSISIITVVNKLNLNEIMKLTEFVRNELPVDEHGPSPMRGEPYDTTLLPPSYKEWDELAKNLLAYHRRRNKEETGANTKHFLATEKVKYVYDLYTRVLRGGKLPFRCEAGNTIGVLEPDGEVKLCELTEAIGNVRLTDYDFKKTWFSQKADEIRKKIKGCSCTHACFLGPSIELYLPALIKFYFSKRLSRK
jgi:MoaA/NifB/PqqE/SkfB family radical SAM enzyme